MSPLDSPAWLLLVHVLPARPTSVRVRVWRRLQDVGAVALKNSVYVLPSSEQSREDFEWIKSEIQELRGEASVFAANSIDTFTNDEVIAAFRRARQADYTALARDAHALATASGKRAAKASRRPSLDRRIARIRSRLAKLDAIAFFPPPNRDEAAAAVARLDGLTRPGEAGRRSARSDRLDVSRFQRRRWITRPRPGIDRMASAWLIRRFIDPKARFSFAEKPPGGSAVPFDMYAVEFSHTDRGCTFETLVARFGLAAPAVDRIGHIVHDLDLRESRFNEPETPALAHLVEGLRAMHSEDGELLERGIVMFEALYRSFRGSDTPTRTRSRRRSRRTRR